MDNGLFNFSISPDLRVIRKNYCCICGTKLKNKIILLKKFKSGIFGFTFFYEITNAYLCKKCGYKILYDDQLKIKTHQEKCQTIILNQGINLVKKYRIKEYIDKKTKFKFKK